MAHQGRGRVDYVIESGGKAVPVEVKSKETKEKITRSLASFIDQYRPEKAYVLSRNLCGKKKKGETLVKYVPITAIDLVAAENA